MDGHTGRGMGSRSRRALPGASSSSPACGSRTSSTTTSDARRCASSRTAPSSARFVLRLQHGSRLAEDHRGDVPERHAGRVVQGEGPAPVYAHGKRVPLPASRPRRGPPRCPFEPLPARRAPGCRTLRTPALRVLRPSAWRRGNSPLSESNDGSAATPGSRAAQVAGPGHRHEAYQRARPATAVIASASEAARCVLVTDDDEKRLFPRGRRFEAFMAHHKAREVGHGGVGRSLEDHRARRLLDGHPLERLAGSSAAWRKGRRRCHPFDGLDGFLALGAARVVVRGGLRIERARPMRRPRSRPPCRSGTRTPRSRPSRGPRGRTARPSGRAREISSAMSSARRDIGWMPPRRGRGPAPRGSRGEDD